MLFKVSGHLSHEDYLVIVPFMQTALKGIKKLRINALVDLSCFEGWDMEARWSNLSLGLKYGSAFEKIAVFGAKHLWMTYGTVFSSWFVEGDMRTFETKREALEWMSK